MESRVQVGNVHPLARELHQLVSVIASGAHSAKAFPNELDEFAAARANVEAAAERALTVEALGEFQNFGVDAFRAH